MIRVALCGSIAFEGADLASALPACAPNGCDVHVESYSSPTDLIDVCLNVDEDGQPVDLILAHLMLPGINALQVASELQQSGRFDDGLRFVLCAPDESRTASAMIKHIDGYLTEPITDASLNETVGALLARIAHLHSESTVLRFRDGVRRLPFSQVVYAETTGRDQTIRRYGNDPLVTRCSSRTLFTQLDSDHRFFKLGSSYIINLDYVDTLSLRGGNVKMLDGTTIPVPVRLRTVLADAICQYADIAI